MKRTNKLLSVLLCVMLIFSALGINAVYAEEGYEITFVTDEHSSVTVYDTQDLTSGGTENAISAIAKNSDTGEIDTSGSGQVNFIVALDSGYSVDSIMVSGSYKNLKDSSDTGVENGYRITKVSSDLTVTITTKLSSEEDEETFGGTIILNDTSIDVSDANGATADGSTVTISQAGEYTIVGSLSDGQIVVALSDKSEEVTLNFNSVTVTSLTGNPINATKGSVTIANSGTSTFTATAADAVSIYSKNDLTIKGEGTINAVSEKGNGIRCKADLEIGSGDINVTAGNHGIRGDKSIKFTKKAGTITVNAAGDAIKTDAIDSDTLELDTDSSYLPKGTITINGGTFNLTAGGDGIQADYGFVSANSPVITINSGTEGIKVNTTPVDAWYYTDDTSTTTATIQGYIQIDGGTFNITSDEDGIKAADYVNITGGTITIVSALDGIQSGVDYTDSSNNTAYTNGNLTITGGTFNIKTHGGSNGSATEDSCKGIKAIDELVISDGDFTLNCYDDAIHSNYNVTITGGTYEIATKDDGVHADYKLTMGSANGDDDDYTMNISTCYEGLEGSVINYLSGTTTLYATDDGVNAAGDYEENGTYHANTSKSSNTNTSSSFAPSFGGGGKPGNPGGGMGGPNQGMDDTSSYGMLYIKGGKLYVVAKGDGLDSNGSILMSDGVVVVNGTTSGGNGVFDKGDGSGSYFKVTGGTLVGFGTTDMQDNPIISGQSYLSTTTSLTKGSTKNILLSTGKYLGIVPEITLSNALLFVTTPDMTSSRQVYSGTVSYSSANKVLGRTQNGIWYGIYMSDYDNNSDDNDDTTEKVSTPTASVSSGSVTSGTKVYLTTTTSGATIYYTTNGNTPTTSSTVYSSGISITSATTIKAIAVKSGMENSDMLTVSYTIKSSGSGSSSGSSSSGSTSSGSSGSGSGGSSSGPSSSSGSSFGTSSRSTTGTSNATDETDDNTPSTEEAAENTSLSGTYSDVLSSDWYYNAVDYVTSRNLMYGVSSEQFEPQAPTTRAMLITVLYRIAGEPAVSSDNSFSDIAENAYYKDAVLWGKNLGIIFGVTDTEFAPDEMISREQMATMMYRYAKKIGYADTSATQLNYNDSAEINDYAVEAVMWASQNKIMNGHDTGDFAPLDSATRAQMATVLMNMLERLT